MRLDKQASAAAALRAMAECWTKWENAKDDFVALRASYTEGELTNLELGIALDRAGSDDRVKKAIKDTAYYRSEAMAYAAILTALRSAQ
jgi:DNA polymerase/3'-5' exonuclease PolX